LPWANGWYSQPPFGTYTLELSPMLGAPKKDAIASAITSSSLYEIRLSTLGRYPLRSDFYSFL
jgi:hypothetical protein